VSLKYIVGRPFALGDKNLEPGDELTEKDLNDIPRLESWVSMRFIYRVYSGKDYNHLPPYLFAIVQTKKEALAKIEASTRGVVGEDEAAAQAQADGAQDHLSKKAESQMKIQDFIYEQVNRAKKPTTEEDEVKDDKGIERVDPAKLTESLAVPTGDDIAEMDKAEAKQEEESDGITLHETPEEDEEATKGEEKSEEFDPSEHTAAEVQEYLDENPDDRDRVLAAEKDGKARKGILGS